MQEQAMSHRSILESEFYRQASTNRSSPVWSVTDLGPIPRSLLCVINNESLYFSVTGRVIVFQEEFRWFKFCLRLHWISYRFINQKSSRYIFKCTVWVILYDSYYMTGKLSHWLTMKFQILQMFHMKLQ